MNEINEEFPFNNEIEDIPYERKGIPEYSRDRVTFGGYFFGSRDNDGVVEPHISFFSEEDIDDIFYDYPQDPWSIEEIRDIANGGLSDSLILFLSQTNKSYVDKYGFVHEYYGDENQFFGRYFAAIDGDVSKEIEYLDQMLALPEFIDPANPEYPTSKPFKKAILEMKAALEDRNLVNDAFKSLASILSETNYDTLRGDEMDF